MTMKKFVLLSVLIAAMPLVSMAQDDDLYFNPKEQAKKEAAAREQAKREFLAERERRNRELAALYSGSNRDVDEYNRNGHFLSKYQNIGVDSLGNDVITFQVGKGVQPDSIYDDAAFVQKYIDKYSSDDFEYTRGFSRWDGYYDPWFYNYYGVGPYYWRSGYWGWYNPWRYGYYAGWYDPWYDPFYDSWYYGYAGWYDPWYYGYGWGGYYPWYWGAPVITHVGYKDGFAGRKNYYNPGRLEPNGSYNSTNRANTYTRRSGSNRSFGQFQPNNSGFNNGGFGSRGNMGGGSFGGGNAGGSFGGNRGGGGFGGAHTGGSFGNRR